MENSLFLSFRKRLKFYYSQNVKTFMKKKITEFSKLESFYRKWCSNHSAFTENKAIYEVKVSRQQVMELYSRV